MQNLKGSSGPKDTHKRTKPLSSAGSSKARILGSEKRGSCLFVIPDPDKCVVCLFHLPSLIIFSVKST